ncbi:MAG TPA: toll/interleukin-1 receptor domain-containing protein [Mycobacterium sp.]|nr:toll/interleukin-1 receptor domain-containing protein [Mycobacterium sp.]
MPVRKVFISYARKNKRDVGQVVEHLGVLGCDTWHDSSLHGGQDWWNEILRQIADCDTFIAILSREALNSTACRREYDWAESLEKPLLPVAVEPLPKALPRRFSIRQIVDYSDPAARDKAALALAGGLATLSPAPPLPDPLPEPPAVPLSYLTDLTDLVAEQKGLDHEQQRHILNHLEPALHSVDPEERRGGHDILEMLGSRDDLYADVYRTISRLKDLVEDTASVRSSDHVGERPADLTEHPPRPAKNTGEFRAGTTDGTVGQRWRQLFLSPVGPRGRRYHPKIVASAIAIALVTVAAIVVVANHKRVGNQQLYPAYILEPTAGVTGVNVYAEPKLSAPVKATLPLHTDIYIECVAVGDPVEGPGPKGQPRQTTSYWDKVSSQATGRELGFVPDVWVNTNGTAPVGPNC